MFDNEDDDLFLSDIGSLSQIYDERASFNKNHPASNRYKKRGAKNQPPFWAHVSPERNFRNAAANNRAADTPLLRTRFDDDDNSRQSSNEEPSADDPEIVSRNMDLKLYDDGEIVLPVSEYESNSKEKRFGETHSEYENVVNRLCNEFGSHVEHANSETDASPRNSQPQLLSDSLSSLMHHADIENLPWRKGKNIVNRNPDESPRENMGKAFTAAKQLSPKQHANRESGKSLDDFSIEKKSFGKWYDPNERKRIAEKVEIAAKPTVSTLSSNPDELLDENYPNIGHMGMSKVFSHKPVKLSLETRDEKSENSDIRNFDDEPGVPKKLGVQEDDDVIILDEAISRNPNYVKNSPSHPTSGRIRISLTDKSPHFVGLESKFPDHKHEGFSLNSSSGQSTNQIPVLFRNTESNTGGSNVSAGSSSLVAASSTSFSATLNVTNSKLKYSQPPPLMQIIIPPFTGPSFGITSLPQPGPPGVGDESDSEFTEFGASTATSNITSNEFFSNCPPPSFSNFQNNIQQPQHNWMSMNAPASNVPSMHRFSSSNVPPPRADAQMSKPASNDAVKEEIRQQNKNLMAQRDQYYQKYNLLGEELSKLKKQKKDLLEGKKSHQQEQFLKENDRLQAEIQSKIKAVRNVIDVLSKIIKVDDVVAKSGTPDEKVIRTNGVPVEVKEIVYQNDAKERRSRRSSSRSKHRPRSKSRRRSRSKSRRRSRSKSRRRSRSKSRRRSRSKSRHRSRSSSRHPSPPKLKHRSRSKSKHRPPSKSKHRSRSRSRRRSHSISQPRSRPRRSRSSSPSNIHSRHSRPSSVSPKRSRRRSRSKEKNSRNNDSKRRSSREKRDINREKTDRAVTYLESHAGDDSRDMSHDDATSPVTVTSSSRLPEKIKSFQNDKNAVVTNAQKKGTMEECKASKRVNYVYYDPEIHWCEVCNVFPATAKEYLLHLHEAEHKNELTKRNLIDYPWHSTQTETKKETQPDLPTERVPIRGLPFFVSATAWYCKLCGHWMGDLHCASAHLKSDLHEKNYKVYVAANPKWEEKWLRNRTEEREKKARSMSTAPGVFTCAMPPAQSTTTGAGVFTCAMPPAMPFNAAAKLKFPVRKRTISSTSSSSCSSSDSSSSSSSSSSSNSGVKSSNAKGDSRVTKKSKKSKKKKRRQNKKEEKLQPKTTTEVRAKTKTVPSPSVKSAPVAAKPKAPVPEKNDTEDDKFVDEWMNDVRRPNNDKQFLELKNKLKKKEVETRAKKLPESKSVKSDANKGAIVDEKPAPPQKSASSRSKEEQVPKKILEKPIVIGKSKFPFIGKMPSKSLKKAEGEGGKSKILLKSSSTANGSKGKGSEDNLSLAIRKQLADLDGAAETDEQDACNTVVDMDINDDDDDVVDANASVNVIVDDNLNRRKDFEETLKILYPEENKMVDEVPLPVPMQQLQAAMVQPMMPAMMPPMVVPPSHISNITQDYLVSLIESTLIEKLKLKLPGSDDKNTVVDNARMVQLTNSVQQALFPSANVADVVAPGTYDVPVENIRLSASSSTAATVDVSPTECNVSPNEKLVETETVASVPKKKKNPISQKKRRHLRKIREKLEEQEKQLQEKIDETRKSLGELQQSEAMNSTARMLPITDIDSDLLLLGIDETDSAALQF